MAPHRSRAGQQPVLTPAVWQATPLSECRRSSRSHPGAIMRHSHLIYEMGRRFDRTGRLLICWLAATYSPTQCVQLPPLGLTFIHPPSQRGPGNKLWSSLTAPRGRACGPAPLRRRSRPGSWPVLMASWTRLEVALDLVGVCLGEVDEGTFEAVAAAQVGRDREGSPARAWARARAQPQAAPYSARPGVARAFERALHVAELTPVEVAGGAPAPGSSPGRCRSRPA